MAEAFRRVIYANHGILSKEGNNWPQFAVSTVALLVGASILPFASSAAPPEAANPAFHAVWERADMPVANGRASRSWLWGPQANADRMEPLAESPGGMRQVEYYDKARMEINNPSADPTSPWFVTNGLLVYEMITGQIQVGNDQFEQRQPANILVAGDGMAADPGNKTPTYASLLHVTSNGGVQGQVRSKIGQEVRDQLSADGTVSQSPLGVSLPKIADYEKATGHNIPTFSGTFLNQKGIVYANGQYKQTWCSTGYTRWVTPSASLTGFRSTWAARRCP